MTKTRIYCILLKFRGLSWAARELSVNKGTLSRFLRGERAGEELGESMDRLTQLAKRLEATDGRAVRDVDGPSVRAEVSKLRRKGKRK